MDEQDILEQVRTLEASIAPFVNSIKPFTDANPELRKAAEELLANIRNDVNRALDDLSEEVSRAAQPTETPSASHHP